MAVLAKITEGQRSAILVSLGVVGLISVVTLATMVPLYVTTRNDFELPTSDEQYAIGCGGTRIDDVYCC